MTEKKAQRTELDELDEPVPEELWQHEFQEVYYDKNQHRFFYVSEEDASNLTGIPLDY